MIGTVFNPQFAHEETEAPRHIVGNNCHIHIDWRGQNQDLNFFDLFPKQHDAFSLRDYQKAGIVRARLA